MTRASDTWTVLQDAMKHTQPACLDDGRFILDDQPASTLTYVCDDCPLFTPCQDYATASRPTGGVWAGKRYTPRTRRHPN